MHENANELTTHVLLVDDEEDLVTLLAQRLRKRGLDVTTATSGPEAVAAAAYRRFDVAVVDLKMPGMDGVAVMQRLKELQPFLETVMFTGHGSTESALEAGRLEAFRYVMKPCPFDELLSIIREAHQHRQSRLREMFQAEMQDVMRSQTVSSPLSMGGRSNLRIWPLE